MKNYSGKTLTKVGTIGSIVLAICCFTPILVILLGVIGFGALTGYLDYVLFPGLAVFMLIAVYGFWKRKKTSKRCCAEKTGVM